jgi:hypothetical protein
VEAPTSYGPERSDVLLSIQLVLIGEEEREQAAPARRDRIEVPAAFRRMQPLGPPVDRGSAVRSAAHPSMPRRCEPELIEPATGARTMASLHRDLLPQGSARLGGPFSLVALRAVPDQGGLDSEAADRVFRALVEVAPFVLTPGARLYRVERDQVALLLPGRSDDIAGAARAGLEASLRRVLNDRELPAVGLELRPAALPAEDQAGRLAAEPLRLAAAG